MRNFKKVMALAVSVAAICSSVSAFAELEYTYTDDLVDVATYDADGRTLTLDVAGATGDKTVLVLANGKETVATGDDILYINQYTEKEKAYFEMGLKGDAALAEGSYVVKYGYTNNLGEFAIAEGKIVAAPKEEGQEITLVYGDVTADGAADAQDAGAILATAIGGDVKVNDKAYEIGSMLGTIVYGDVTADGAADAQDAGAILATAIGGDVKVNDKAYEIGSNVTVTIK